MSEHAITTLQGSDLADLIAWIDEQHRQKAKRVVLRVRQDTGTEQVVREMPLDPDGASAASEIAQSLMGRARSAARLQSGRTSFVVNAYNERGDAIDLFGFVITSETAIRRDEAVHVELTSLLMRHTEASARLSLGHTLAIVEKYRELLEAREAQVASLERRITDMAEANERVMSIRFEREMMTLQANADVEGKRYAREKFDLLLPVLMSKVLPDAAKPVRGSFLLEEMVDKVVSSLTTSQMTQIMPILNTEQQVALASIVQAYNERGTARQAAQAAKSASASTTTSTDAAA
jgi:hypothetical protein